MFGSALAEAAAATGRADWARRRRGHRRVPARPTCATPTTGAGCARGRAAGPATSPTPATTPGWSTVFTRLAELTGRPRWLDDGRRDGAGAMLDALRRRQGARCTPPGPTPSSLVVRPDRAPRRRHPRRPTRWPPAPCCAWRRSPGDDELDRRRRGAPGRARPAWPPPTRWPPPTPWPPAALAGGGITEVVVTGDRPDLVAAVGRRFEPTVVLAWGERTASPLWDGARRRARPTCAGTTPAGAPADQPPTQLEAPRLDRRAGAPTGARRRRPRARARRPDPGRREPAPWPRTRRRPEAGRAAHRGRARPSGTQEAAGPRRPGRPPLHGARLQRPRTPPASTSSTGALRPAAHRLGRGARGRPSPFDVVDAAWAADPERDDLAQPEAVTVAGHPRGARAPSRGGGPAGCCATWWLPRPAAPARLPRDRRRPTGSSDGMRPVGGRGGPHAGAPCSSAAASDDTVWARFGWPRSDNWLPVEDRRAVAALWACPARPPVGQGPRRRPRLPAPLRGGGAQPAPRRPLLQDGGRHPAPSLSCRAPGVRGRPVKGGSAGLARGQRARGQVLGHGPAEGHQAVAPLDGQTPLNSSGHAVVGLLHLGPAQVEGPGRRRRHRPG